MELRIIKTKKQYQAYLDWVDVQFDKKVKPGSPQGEKVQVVNNNNGERFETYTITGKRGSGDIILNGAAARRVVKGDVVIIITYAIMEAEEARKYKPIVVFPNEENNLLIK